MPLSTDYLVIGSGLAGLAAGLTLAERGDVTLVTKASLLESNSRYAQAGIAAVRNTKWDSFEEHIRDTLTAGCGVNDRTAVEFLVHNAPAAVEWLTTLGVPFAKEPTREAAHSHSRVWHTGDSTGATIEKVLARHVRKNKRIRILTDTSLLDLMVEKNICRGAIFRTDTRIFSMTAGATILATGGYGALYARTTNPAVSVGDGIAAALRIGAKVKDLEFVQFHPTALVGTSRRLTLLSESLRGEGAVLRNSRGERFMPSYHAAAELAPRDIVSRAIFEELKRGPVYLDFTRADRKWLRQRFPFIWKEVQKAGFDLGREQIPVFPVAHYACGGVATNVRGETSIKHLLAVGEVACTGLHGANRLASNSLAEAVVFGRAAGVSARSTNAAKHSECKSQNSKVQNYVFDIGEDRATIDLVRKTMWEDVGIIRTKAGLAHAQKTLATLAPKSHAAINAVTVARAVVAAALRRQKSLGTHYRVD